MHDTVIQCVIYIVIRIVYIVKQCVIYIGYRFIVSVLRVSV